jgi:Protein of unknown function (DUF1569)
VKNIFEAEQVKEVKERIWRLRPDSKRQWGTMSVAQAVTHCAVGLEIVTGERVPSKAPLPFRILGKIIKPMALGNDTPMRRNSPTSKEFLVGDHQNLEPEQKRLCALIDQFAAAGPEGCTRHPHGFFGKLTPGEWAELMYKHLDHHLRQFGV